jgi:hypothetical protein
MRANPLPSLLPAVLGALVACTEPQTPVSEGPTTEGTAAPTITAAPTTETPATTAAPTLTTVPTGASSVTAPGTATAAGTAAPIEKLDAPYVLVFRQSGGIAGMLMETVVDAGAKTITYGGLRNQKPETKPLTAEDVAAITRVLEEARYAGFSGQTKGQPFPDAFSYTITVKKGGKEYTVSWYDGTTVPDAYSTVRSTVNSIRSSKFGGAPPKGAPTI